MLVLQKYPHVSQCRQCRVCIPQYVIDEAMRAADGISPSSSSSSSSSSTRGSSGGGSGGIESGRLPLAADVGGSNVDSLANLDVQQAGGAEAAAAVAAEGAGVERPLQSPLPAAALAAAAAGAVSEPPLAAAAEARAATEEGAAGAGGGAAAKEGGGGGGAAATAAAGAEGGGAAAAAGGAVGAEGGGGRAAAGEGAATGAGGAAASAAEGGGGGGAAIDQLDTALPTTIAEGVVPGITVVTQSVNHTFDWEGNTYQIAPDLSVREGLIRRCEVCRGCQHMIEPMPKGEGVHEELDRS